MNDDDAGEPSSEAAAEQATLDAANEYLRQIEAAEQAELDAANEQLGQVEAAEQAKLDAANEQLRQVEAAEQAELDAANEYLRRETEGQGGPEAADEHLRQVEAAEQAKLDAANEHLRKVEAAEQAKLDAANEYLRQVEAAQQSQSSSRNLTKITVAVSLIAAVIAALALQRTKPRSATPAPRQGQAVTQKSPVVPNYVVPEAQQPVKANVAVHARESDGRTITFQSTKLTNPGGLDTDFGRNFRGKGKGIYREQFTSDQCQFTIVWTGEVDVEILARVAEHEVTVVIGGPVTQQGDWPGASCLDGTYYAPNRPLPATLGYSCRIDNVDFKRGGSYRGPPPEDTPDPYSCTLAIEPIKP